MATEVKLPRLGQGMESGTIVRWLKAEGDAVKANEPLYELDTDKVTQEVESEVDGVLLRIVVQEGETEVGTTIAVIGSDSNDVTVQETPTAGEVVEPGPEAAVAPAAPAAEAPLPAGNGSVPEHVAPSPGARIKASPLARRIARERGLELSSIAGTGPDGRILAEDVERAPVGGRPQPHRPRSLRRAPTSR